MPVRGAMNAQKVYGGSEGGRGRMGVAWGRARGGGLLGGGGHGPSAVVRSVPCYILQPLGSGLLPRRVIPPSRSRVTPLGHVGSYRYRAHIAIDAMRHGGSHGTVRFGGHAHRRRHARACRDSRRMLYTYA